MDIIDFNKPNSVKKVKVGNYICFIDIVKKVVT